MTAEQGKCVRCGGAWPTVDNIVDTSFWGLIQTKTATAVTKSLHFRAAHYRPSTKTGSSMLRVDEEQKMCSDCWGLLVGRFMQGRDVPAMAGKEGR